MIACLHDDCIYDEIMVLSDQTIKSNVIYLKSYLFSKYKLSSLKSGASPPINVTTVEKIMKLVARTKLRVAITLVQKLFSSTVCRSKSYMPRV